MTDLCGASGLITAFNAACICAKILFAATLRIVCPPNRGMRFFVLARISRDRGKAEVSRWATCFPEFGGGIAIATSAKINFQMSL